MLHIGILDKTGELYMHHSVRLSLGVLGLLMLVNLLSACIVLPHHHGHGSGSYGHGDRQSSHEEYQGRRRR